MDNRDYKYEEYVKKRNKEIRRKQLMIEIAGFVITIIVSAGASLLTIMLVGL